MIKELILAIVLGAVLGFGVTGSFFAIKSNKNPLKASQNSPTPVMEISQNQENSVSPTPQDSNLQDTQSEDNPIYIDEPANETIVGTSKITISGTTIPDSVLVFVSPINTYTTTANSSGVFEIEVSLEAGVNLIDISSIDPQDNQSTTQLLVTYSTATI